MTWLDATFEDTYTTGGPSITITVGFKLPPRWKAHESYAQNVVDGEPWAVVHIPTVLIVKKEKLSHA